VSELIVECTPPPGEAPSSWNGPNCFFVDVAIGPAYYYMVACVFVSYLVRDSLANSTCFLRALCLLREEEAITLTAQVCVCVCVCVCVF
jgi:hypothetical protein